MKNIDFVITVTNEGLVTVGAVIITDYIPLGFTLNDPDWTPGNAGSTGQSASITLSVANGGLDANGLNPGEMEQDGEGKQIMEVLGKNMAWIMNVIAAGKEQFPAPEPVAKTMTKFWKML